MCICINCKHVRHCSTYYVVEKQHNKINVNKEISFVANSPVVKINIIVKNQEANLDWDIVECLSFTEKPGEWLS